jgi:hypothetical protein
MVDARLPLTPIHQGGYLFFPPTEIDAYKAAVIKFQDSDDTKATALFSLSYSSGTVRAETWIYLLLKLKCWQLVAIAILLYDGPTPPQGLFDDFLAIPTIQQNVSSRSFYDLVSSLGFGNPTVPTRLVAGYVAQ